MVTRAIGRVSVSFAMGSVTMKNTKRYKHVILRGQQYVFDRHIFRITVAALALLFVVAVYANGGLSSKMRLVCPGETACKNPLYIKEGFATAQGLQYLSIEEGRSLGIPDYVRRMETLPAGFRLNDPSPLVSLCFLLFPIFLILGFVVNHLVHNRDFSFYIWYRMG